MNFSNTNAPLWQRLSLILFILISQISAADNIPNFDLDYDSQFFNMSSAHWADNSQISIPAEAKVQLADGELIKKHFHIPFTKASHWFAFTLTNITDHALSKNVYIQEAYPQKVNLHYQQQGQWISDLNGTDIALNERSVINRLPVFDINLEANESRTFYLEIHSKVKLLGISLNVEGSEITDGHTIGDQRAAIVILYIGAGILISLINMLMYFSFRDRIYLFYSVYCASFVATTMVMNSFDLFFDFPLQDRNILFLTYHIMIIFLSLFIAEVLQTKSSMPWVDMVLKTARYLALVIGIMTFFDMSYFSYTLIVFMPLSILFLGITIFASLVGAPNAKLLSLGIAFFLSGILITMLGNLGIFPSSVVTLYSVLIGALVEMMIFSVALFRRVLSLNTSINMGNLKALTLAEQSKLELEKTVVERTHELNQAKQAAEQANKNTSEFFANINHEMRTPLNGILGIIGIIGQQDDQKVSARHFKTLKTASHQLSSLVSNVLDHSKLSSNAVFEIQSTHFSVSDLVNELEDIFFNMADDKGLSLSFHVQGDLTLDRYGDYGKLRQILINIMGNAIKFSHSGQVELTVLQGALENELTFILSDTGDGISEEQIEHIFTAYHQVPGSNDFRQEGSGLGLSISNTLTTIMGGTLSVESELGKGSHFTLRLPLKTIIAHHKKDSHTTRTINPVDLSGKCILVVDDSDVNQEVVCAFLSSTGITVVAVTDGKQALDRFQLGGIDIVLMDLHMGVMDGITATSRIREFEANNSIEHCPIILHTADTGEEVLYQANQAGADHFLYKPYSQVQLLSTLCEFIDLEFDSQAVDVVEVSQMKPLVDRFLDHFNTSLTTCHRHIEHNDFDALGQEIHQMLGNCGVFGATSMFATLTEVKTLLNENKIEPLPMRALLATVTEQLLVYRQTGKQY